MKLLICTQIVDRHNPALGFFYRWIEEFAKHCTEMHVICLKEGEHSFPSHVHIHSLGKEDGKRRLTYLWRFYKYVWTHRRDYDNVFVHMNPEYVTLGFPIWFLLRKKVGLWYTHKSVNVKLRVAALLAHRIFTASPESFRLKNSKVKVTGHGVDVHMYICKAAEERPSKLITVGRISRSKAYEDMIEAVVLLREKGMNVTLDIIGGPFAFDDEKYLEEIRKRILEKNLENEIYLLGGVSHSAVRKHLVSHDVFVNTSKTGSLDKAVLEAMASCVPVVTTNEGLASVLKDESQLFCSTSDSAEFAKCIENVLRLPASERQQLSVRLRENVAQNHSLSTLIQTILRNY